MIPLALGALLIATGLPFLVRGWIFTLKPDGGVSQKAKERNLRLGLETDMARWGRKVRRFGLMLTLAGGGLAFWGSRLLGT